MLWSLRYEQFRKHGLQGVQKANQNHGSENEKISNKINFWRFWWRWLRNDWIFGISEPDGEFLRFLKSLPLSSWKNSSSILSNLSTIWKEKKRELQFKSLLNLQILLTFPRILKLWKRWSMMQITVTPLITQSHRRTFLPLWKKWTYITKKFPIH